MGLRQTCGKIWVLLKTTSEDERVCVILYWQLGTSFGAMQKRQLLKEPRFLNRPSIVSARV